MEFLRQCYRAVTAWCLEVVQWRNAYSVPYVMLVNAIFGSVHALLRKLQTHLLAASHSMPSETRRRSALLQQQPPFRSGEFSFLRSRIRASSSPSLNGRFKISGRFVSRRLNNWHCQFRPLLACSSACPYTASTMGKKKKPSGAQPLQVQSPTT